jgi:hypothetical protein
LDPFTGAPQARTEILDLFTGASAPQAHAEILDPFTRAPHGRTEILDPFTGAPQAHAEIWTLLLMRRRRARKF